MRISEFLEDLNRLQSEMLYTRAKILESKMSLYRDYPHKEVDMILDHSQLLQQYNTMLDILFRININLDAIQQGRSYKTINDSNEIKKYLTVYYRKDNPKSHVNVIPDSYLIRTAVLIINPVSKKLEFIINCHSKDWLGKKFSDKGNYISNGTLKKVRFGTSFEFSTYPLQQRAKISIKPIGDTFYTEQEALNKLGDICKFGVRDAFGATYIKNNNQDFETVVGFDLRARCDLFAYASKYKTGRTIYLIFSKIAHDLSIIHNRKMVHRDIKPENILIDWQDENDPISYIADLATVVELSSRVYSVMVTPTYSSPRSILRRIEVASSRINDEDFYKLIESNLSNKRMDLCNMQIEFFMSVFKKQSLKKWIKDLDLKDDPRKCDVWSLGITYYFYMNRCYPCKNYDMVVELSPVLKVVLSIDDRFRPTAEEFLTIISAQYIIDTYGNETNEKLNNEKLNEDLKYIGGIQGLYDSIRRFDITRDFVKQDKINQIVLESKYKIYDKAMEILEKIIVNKNLPNNIPMSSTAVPIVYSYGSHVKEMVATNEDDKPTKNRRELVMSKNCDCRIS